MIFTTDEEAILIIKQSQAVPKWVQDARKYNTELCALVNGDDFANQLIETIEKLETEAKKNVRKKYARDISDLFERLALPIQNVFSSTGGVKDYTNDEYKMPKAFLEKLLKIVSNVRDGKSLERYVENQWINLYHTDPFGVLWTRYVVKDGKVDQAYPTYWGINNIRNYIAKGQLVEWILYEPEKVEGKQVWTIVDDAMQRTITQDGETYTVNQDPLKTFEHPFGTCPVIIISDIVDKNGSRRSPLHKLLGLTREYARDQSIKTIYKFQQGFPKHWRRVMFCKKCNGVGKNGTESCPDCKGTGELGGKMDVADVALIPMPEEGQPVVSGDDIMGFNSPDLETWKQFNTELELLEDTAYYTHWGVCRTTEQKTNKTATEVVYDTQPQINKLNKYADIAEWIEWTITEWIANAVDPTKPKEQNISLIVYGRRYILEGVDTIQQKYEKAKEAGDNSCILDGIFDELLTIKFKNDPEWLAQELLKARVEPYLHNSAQEVNEMFGPIEAMRKVYFQRWWKNLKDADMKKEPEVLQADFALSFTAHLGTVTIQVNQGAAAGGAAGADDHLGKLPLAVQQLALARERAMTAGDTGLADKLSTKMDELLAKIAA